MNNIEEFLSYLRPSKNALVHCHMRTHHLLPEDILEVVWSLPTCNGEITVSHRVPYATLDAVVDVELYATILRKELVRKLGIAIIEGQPNGAPAV